MIGPSIRLPARLARAPRAGGRRRICFVQMHCVYVV